MEFSWGRDYKDDICLYVNDIKGIIDELGWVIRVGDRYEVTIGFELSPDRMPCEREGYPTLRHAMRALKTTVTVLLIGGHYGF